MSMDSKDQKQYADVGIQTSPVAPSLGSISSTTNTGSGLLAEVSLSLPSLAQSDSPVLEESPGRKGCISTNRYVSASDSHALPLLPSFPSSFGLRCSTSSSRLNSSSNRTVSLPETLYDEDLRLVLSQLMDSSDSEAREQLRVVSMPESLQLRAQRCATANTRGYLDPNIPSLDAITSDEMTITTNEDLRSKSSTPSTPGTIVVHSLSSDPYHTPSPPPSSCDSIEFTLEDPAHLPDTFLRGSTSPPTLAPTASNKTAGLLEDDGWLTWATSPPRPIPALHGPSSLPYARCPSGAEGTIIGEPSSLPRMIWGLDPNDTVPNPHIPQPQTQQSRAVSIKPLSVNFKTRCNTHQGAFSVSTPASSSSLHVGPRFGNSDTNYNSFEQVKTGREISSMPTVLEARQEEEPRCNSRRMARRGPDHRLHASVHEEPTGLEHRYEHNIRGDGVMDCSHLLSLGPSNTVDSVFELLPPEETPHQHPSESRNQDETHMQYSYEGSRNGHPSRVFDLLSSPVALRDRPSNPYPRVVSGARPRLIAQDYTSSYLPTPPNSTSPQWTSAFSPLRNGRSHSTGSTQSIGDISSGVVRTQAHTMNDELSEELRRFVFENMSPVGSANGIDAPQFARTGHTSARSMYMTARNALISSESPSHPPGLPIPRHILLSKALEPFDPLSAQEPSPKSTSPSTSPYTRSTLSNPRSIPLSRLRQKRGAVKLATVPEEDSAEPHVHNGRLAPPSLPPLRLLLRTPSPLDDRLQAQSIEDKATFGDDSKLRQARVKLPHSTNSRTDGAQGGYFDHSQNTILQISPKKKRLQRKKKPMRPVELEKSRFPLISEGTVSFGSSNSFATQDIRKEAERLSLVDTHPARQDDKTRPT